jgi:transaldolase / glucose-6-phosphate isomerase
MTNSNPVAALQRFGQSVWLDDLRRSLFTSGKFGRLIAEDGLRGVTSNPSIFEKAIVGTSEYEAALSATDRGSRPAPVELYEALAIRDIQTAADLLRPVYQATDGADGYASLEVSPFLAYDTDGTITEARRLWQAVGRRNVMIKVPACREGLPAIRQLTSEGINVNITLLFAVERYEEVAQAYIDGLALFSRAGGDVARVSSVASFFVSRIDTLLDEQISSRVRTVADAQSRSDLESLLGQVAIASARLAYQKYLAVCRADGWQRLAAKGARPQRLLWASTSTKNPRYRDVRYVEELIGSDTVTTLTLPTMEAFRKHGRLRASLEEDLDDAHRVIDSLERLDISLRDATTKLLDDGVAIFCSAFERLLASVRERVGAIDQQAVAPATWRAQ